MPPQAKNSDTWRSEDAVSVLAVNQPPDDVERLRDIFTDARWLLCSAGTFPDALRRMRRSHYDIVMADQDDRVIDWREILAHIACMPDPPLLIVTSRIADESLWAEVLNEGGYDVLAKPFDREEVLRVVSAARRRSRNEWDRQAQASMKLAM